MRAFHLLFGSCILFLLVSFLGEAKSDHGVYIVYMGAPRNDHPQLVSQLLMDRENDSLVHTYGKSFSGFAAHLSDEEAESIARQPEVVSVFRERASKIHTTRSWDFLMSQYDYSSFKHDYIQTMMNSQSLSCSIGADTIIGVIDTGIWPEHPSFDDNLIKDPIPTRWKGECMHDISSVPVKCNRKLIGARYYKNVTARDWDGHGTNVASIAAGSPVWGASYKGLAQGVARGGSPCSRIAAYCICDYEKCWFSDILKAFDDAIADGVDVISISWGREFDNFLKDAIAIGSFHAVEKGITVVCSAGNSGPWAIMNFAPWILTVGATSIDSALQISIVLGGNSGVVQGRGIYFGGLKQTAVYPLTDGRSASSNQDRIADAINCIPGSLDDAKVKGKIVLCFYNDKTEDTIKFAALKKQGVIGVICNDFSFYAFAEEYSDLYQIPFAAVNDEDAAKILSYINSTRNPLATLFPTQTIINYKPAPVVAIYSSRGPPAHGMHNIIKPDVVAPGVNILAGMPPNEKNLIFEFDSGTSLSCPHVSGLAAMLKSVHPTWSPSAIKSAIMTIAIQTNNLHSPIQIDDGSIATPHDMGSGEINPIGSLWRPGLVYETSTADYVQFLCNMSYNASAIRIMLSTFPKDNFSCLANSNPDLISDMNYPSIFVSGLIANVGRTVKRTVTNVGEACSTYTATVVAPTNVHVQVVPKILRFTKNVKTLTFQVSFNLTATSHNDMFGSITWCNDKYITVRSPFVVGKA